MAGVVAFFLSPLGKLAGAIALMVALYLGIQAWGASQYRAGEAAEKLKWELASEIERARQAGARAAVEKLGAEIVTSITNKVAGLEPILKDLKDDAAKESEQPLPLPAPGCPDVYRGIAPDSLRKLEGAR